MTFFLRTRWPLLACFLIHVLIFAVLFNTDIYGTRYSAIGLYWDFASKVMDGQVVYRDFAMEYPPLSLLFFILPRLFTSDITAYGIAFNIEMLVFDLLALLMISALSRRLGLKSWLTMGVYTLSVLAVGPLIADRYDLVPGVMVLAAVYAFIAGREKTAWGMAAAGMMTKLFPAVLVPLFMIIHLRRRQYRRLPGALAAYAIVTAAITVPFLLLAPAGFWASLFYHIDRGCR